jgi:hypothetical protein
MHSLPDLSIVIGDYYFRLAILNLLEIAVILAGKSLSRLLNSGSRRAFISSGFKVNQPDA